MNVVLVFTTALLSELNTFIVPCRKTRTRCVLCLYISTIQFSFQFISSLIVLTLMTFYGEFFYFACYQTFFQNSNGNLKVFFEEILINWYQFFLSIQSFSEMNKLLGL